MRCSVCGAINGKITRSNNQNRYYHGVIVSMLSEHTGYTPEDIHEILKHKFLSQRQVMGIAISSGTSRLTTSEFENYLTRIKEWASIELGCAIPDPNENT